MWLRKKVLHSLEASPVSIPCPPRKRVGDEMVIKLSHNLMTGDPTATAQRINELLSALEKVRSGYPSLNIHFDLELR